MNEKSPKCEHFEECRAKDDCKESGKCRGQDIKDWCHWDGKLELKREAIEKWSYEQWEKKYDVEPLIIKPHEWKQAPKLCDAYITCPVPTKCKELGKCRGAISNPPEDIKEDCRNCRFSRKTYHQDPWTICCRYPPTIETGIEEGNEYTPVSTEDWCGEWKPKK